MRRVQRGIAAILLVCTLGLAAPPKASASCWPGGLPPEIWSLPPELIVWYFYWTYPGLYEWAAGQHFESAQEMVMWLLNIPFCNNEPEYEPAPVPDPPPDPPENP